MIKKIFDVSGMTCAACAAHVEKSVSKTAGVSKVTVNLLSNDMVVEYDESVCTPEMIEENVRRGGYDAKLRENLNSGEKADKKRMAKSGNEEKKLLIELIVSAVFLLSLMYFSMGNMMWRFPAPPVFDHKCNPLGFALIQFVLLLPILYVYRRYFISGFKKLFSGAPNMDTLVAIGSTASVLYGVAALFVMSYYSAQLAGGGLTESQISAYKSIIATYHDNLYFESAGMILCLVSLGKYFERLSKKKTTKAVEALVNLAPDRATVFCNGEEKIVSAEDVKIGDVIVLKKGEKVPVDGKLIQGSVSVDQSNITGESVPVQKKTGDDVYSSTVVTAGYALVEAIKVGEDTSFSNIIKMVEEAAESKAPVSKLADRISGVFVPVILIISLLTFVGNLIAGSSLETALNFAVTVVVIACPCALGLATPVAIMVGTGKAAEAGMIIRNAEILERTKSINVVVFDKTGTITEGQPSVTDFKAIIDEEEALNAVYSLENMSEHPLALAVCEYAKTKNAVINKVDEYKSVDGAGISGKIGGVEYSIGNKTLVARKDKKDEILPFGDACSTQGKTPLYIVKNGEAVGVIAVKDKVKAEAGNVVNQLIARDIDVILLTGDNEVTAKTVAAEVGIKTVISDVLPQDKQTVVTGLKKKGKVVAMVGDGVNDAPALTAADIGIALGGGSDVAVNSGDIVLLKNDLSGVTTSIDLSKLVLRKIKFGLFWAFFYNLICVFIATGIPYYLWGVKITPMIGALAMSFSSVSVVLNALSINLFKTKKSSGRNNEIEKESVCNKEILIADSGDKNDKGTKKMEIVIKVNGMMCAHCVGRVEKAAMSVKGVISAKADLENKRVVIKSDGADIEKIKANIIDAGYEVVE